MPSEVVAVPPSAGDRVIVPFGLVTVPPGRSTFVPPGNVTVLPPGGINASTYTEHVAVKLPIVAVTIVIPALLVFAVIVPEVTVATELSLMLHVTSLLVAFDGTTVAVSFSFEPDVRVIEVLSNVNPATATGWTVTTQKSVILPSAIAVILTVPALPVLFAMTTPELTVANVLSLVLHVTFLFVAYHGLIVAVSIKLPPDASVAFFGATSIEATE
jgi:hypothetical protein